MVHAPGLKAAMRHWPWATALIAALAIVAFAWPAVQSTWLIDRVAVQRGELWRWWTGQLVHFGASHLGWNLAVFIVAGGWLERVDAGWPSTWKCRRGGLRIC